MRRVASPTLEALGEAEAPSSPGGGKGKRKKGETERAQRLEVDAFPTPGPPAAPAQISSHCHQASSYCHLCIQEIYKKKKKRAPNKTKSKRTRLGRMKEEGREDRKVGQVSECIIPSHWELGGKIPQHPAARVALARHVVFGGRLPIHPVEILVARLLGGIEPVSDRQARKGLGDGGCGWERV